MSLFFSLSGVTRQNKEFLVYPLTLNEKITRDKGECTINDFPSMNLLLCCLFFPLFGAFILLFISSEDCKKIKKIALVLF